MKSSHYVYFFILFPPNLSPRLRKGTHFREKHSTGELLCLRLLSTSQSGHRIIPSFDYCWRNAGINKSCSRQPPHPTAKTLSEIWNNFPTFMHVVYKRRRLKHLLTREMCSSGWRMRWTCSFGFSSCSNEFILFKRVKNVRQFLVCQMACACI